MAPLWSRRLLAAGVSSPFRRRRPSDPDWPSPAQWDRLNRAVGGNLIRIASPLAECVGAPHGGACSHLFEQLRNPYYVGDQPWGTQTLGWVDAWTSSPSAYAIAATSAEDIAAGVNFARENGLRLVVKGGAHSYLGTSNAPDSLSIWTRRLNEIVLHDAFVATSCTQPAQPAVTLGAGAIWMHAYDAVTTNAGRYVQGGGCATVGVAGLIQSGGFGSFSKHYGLAAAGLLEAEVVTADGVVRTVNACTNRDLFWALKGGGGGTFGVVSKMTLRVRELPEYFGGVDITIQASSDAAFRRLLAAFVDFYREQLFNDRWGEQASMRPNNTLGFSMVSYGLDTAEATKVWQPFLAWVQGHPRDYTLAAAPVIVSGPARGFWNAALYEKFMPSAIVVNTMPGAKPGEFWWAGDGDQAGQVLNGYESLWLPASLLDGASRNRLVDALFAGSRHWSFSLHFNKGLAGAPPDAVAAAADTAINPAALTAFALAISASAQGPSYPGIVGHEPDLVTGREKARRIHACVNELRAVAPSGGSYVSESDFFENDWQHSYWGSNYARLAEVKNRYDPRGLFYVHNGVGSEDWSADGFTRLTTR